MVVLNVIRAGAVFVLARIRARTLSIATLNALNNSLNYLLVGVKLPPIFDAKLHYTRPITFQSSTNAPNAPRKSSNPLLFDTI